ncbi:MAG: hypothetical protein KDK70_29315, partial [Myxococcales bacterium]|nr:hypothetical protein [Myxococcales bacterium]
LFGVVRWSRSDPSALVLLACAALMIVALVGLYRLRVWGLVLNIAANLLIAGLAIADVLDVPGVVQAALCTTAVVQLVLPVPLLIAMARGRAPEPRTTPHPGWAFAMPALVLGMLGLSLYAQLLPGGLL